MGIKVYISGISGNKEVKKRQQRVLMILESRNIEFSVVDITEPGKENEKDFMQEKSTSSGATVSDTNPRHPLPPQIFNDEEYCGDYDQFDLANENDEIETFLKLAPSNDVDSTKVSNGTGDIGPKPVIESQIDSIIESLETAESPVESPEVRGESAEPEQAEVGDEKLSEDQEEEVAEEKHESEAEDEEEPDA